MTQPPQNPEPGGQEQQTQPTQPLPPQQPAQQPQYAPPAPQQPQQGQYAPPQAPPGQPPYYAAPNAPYQQQPPQAPMNTLAIVAFVASFFVSLVGIICGHIALGQIKKSGERGYGFALAGAIIGWVSAAFTAIAVIVMFLFWGIFATTLWGVSNTIDDVPSLEEDDFPYSGSAYGPAGMESGAAVFNQWLEPEWTPGLEAGASRFAPIPNPDALPLEVTVHVDYMCPACGSFEEEYGDALEGMLKQDEIRLGVYPVTFLDNVSGTEYSTRAANLFGCVVEYDPYLAWDIHRDLLEEGTQPEEGSGGYTDDELLALAESAGAWTGGGIESCVRDQQFAQFFEDNTTVATTERVPSLALDAEPATLDRTPRVVIDGEYWDPDEHPDLGAYLKERIDALG